ncbi:MAG: putative hemolysin, partial [Salibacteraceae bacterium]
MDIEPPSLLLISLLPYTHIASMVILLVLLGCSALISGAEVAFFSLAPSDLEEREEKLSSKKLEIVRKLLTKPKKLLATI